MSNQWYQTVASKLRAIPKRVLIVFALFGIVAVVGVVLLCVARIQPSRLPEHAQKTIGDGYTRLNIPEREPPFFKLVSQTISRFGILPTETFVLSASDTVSKEFLESVIQANSTVSVQKTGETEYRITPLQPLGKDKVFQIKLAVKNKTHNGHTFDRDYSWSFQTQGKFRVISTIPGNKKTNVPVNTGIEFVFSQDDYENPKNLISIEPTIEYRLERHEQTLALVPLEPLDYSTVYTVRLRKGLDLESRSDPITEDVEFSFQTQEESKPEGVISLSTDLIERIPYEAPSVKIHSSNADSLVIKATVYKLTDSSAFINSREAIDKAKASWYSYYSHKSDIDVSSFQVIDTYDLKIEKKDDIEYLILPEPLPLGYYYIRFEYGSRKRFKELWVQVTDLSGFVSVGEKSTVVWANTVSDSKPSSNALVSAYGFSTPYYTNDRGYVVFNTTDMLLSHPGGYVYIKKDEDEVILPVTTTNDHKRESKDDYFAYLYNERRFYKPSDTVNFWGVAKHRDTSIIPQNITVELVDRGYYYGSVSEDKVLVQQFISASGKDGSFSGSLSFSDISPGYYTLRLKSGELVLVNSYITILNYIKPEMKIDVTSSKNAIFGDQTVDFTVLATFFDGTPTSNMGLAVKSSRIGNINDEIKIGRNGRATYMYTPTDEGNYYGSYRQTECIVLTPQATSESTIEGDACVQVFYRKLTVESSSKSEGSTAQLRLNVNHIDLNKYNNDPQKGFKGAPAVDQSVKVVVTKKWSEWIENGTVYDYIEKVTRPRYKHVRKQEELTKLTLQTDQQGSLSYDFEMEQGKSYEADVTISDEDGKTIKTKQYFYYYNQSSAKDSQTALTPQLDINDKDNNLFSKGESVNLVIRAGESSYPDNDKNKFLFLVSTRGKQDAYLQDSPQLSFPFEDKHIPNTAVSAVIFTGKTYSAVEVKCHSNWNCRSIWYRYRRNNTLPELSLVYDKEESELSLSFSYDQSVYQPADNAKITVTVTNDNGERVPDAKVNIALVDQALAAIGGAREPSILTSLYPTVRSGLYYSYNSHKPLIPDESLAEMGGGGGGNDRELFKDTAFFGSAQTNSEGNAVFTFDLPDNITTWNVYGQAVTSSVLAGHSTSTLVTTKDFFVYPAFVSTFLSQDSPLLTGSAFGNGLSKSDTVNFSALVTQSGFEISQISLEGNAFAQHEFPFPSLTQGKYKLSLEGTFHDKQDKVTLPFTVIDSRFAMTKHYKEVLEQGSIFAARDTTGILTDKPYLIVVSDEGKGKYYGEFIRYCYINSNRLERMLAKHVAGSILDEQFGVNTCNVSSEDITSYQGSDGGLSQVVWGGSSLESTIWAISVSSELFNKDSLISYLESQFTAANASTIQKIQAAWGLTSIGKPKLLYLKEAATNAGTYEEKMLTAIALAENGESELARELYFDLLAEYAYENDPYIRIQSMENAKNTLDKTVEDSSHALLLGSLVEPRYNQGLYTYIRDFEYETQDIVLDLAKMAFISGELSKTPDELTTITYSSNKRTLTKEMTTGRPWTISVDPSERDNYTLNVEKGITEITLYYSIGIDGLNEAEKDDKLSLKRSYSNRTGSEEKYQPGDIVEVKLDFEYDLENSPRGRYTITDILPSGLVYIPNPSFFGFHTNDWGEETEKNIITFNVYNTPWWLESHDTNLVYYARVAAAGSYIAEPAIFQYKEKPSIMTHTDSETITITGVDQ